MPEGFAETFEDAVSAALAESEEATSDAPTDAQPADGEEVEAVEDQAPDTPVEHPAEAADEPEEAEADEVEELFDLEDSPEDEEPEAPVVTDETQFELPGVDQPVSLKELKDGFLRQADYTRKTQALAEQRKEAEDAVRFWEAIQANPVDVIKGLAAKAGIPVEGQVKDVEFSPFKTAEDVEAEIQRRVEAQLEEHPTVKTARQAEAQRVIDTEFARIEKEQDVTLGPKSREAILKEAYRTGANDLEVVFHALVARQRKRADKQADLKLAAGSKPSSGRTDSDLPSKVDSFSDAAKLALAEVG